MAAHYTYSEVPYDVWFQKLTGHTFNSPVGWERNNFDRVAHLSVLVKHKAPLVEDEMAHMGRKQKSR